jgi:hypothetical protein
MRIRVLSCHSWACPFDPTNNKKNFHAMEKSLKKASEPSTFGTVNSVTENFLYIAEINLYVVGKHYKFLLSKNRASS